MKRLPTPLPAGTVVVDTDVVSYLFKGDSRSQAYARPLDHALILVSFMTVAELERWAEERNWSARGRQRLRAFLADYIPIHSSVELCRLWGATMAGARRRGRRIEVADAWIAATALFYNVPLVTHNPSDYAGVDGLSVIGGDGADASGAST